MLEQYSHLTKEYLEQFKTNDLVPMQCFKCNKSFWRRKGDLLTNIKRETHTFCSLTCASRQNQINKGLSSIQITCHECGAEVWKTQKDLRRSKSGKVFCSRSCAAIDSNRVKKMPPVICKKCNIEQTPRRDSMYCKQCSLNNFTERELKLDSLTLADVCYDEGPSRIEAKWAKIRGRARSKYKQQIKDGCMKCKYQHHVEVCHIKSISSFPLTATVGEINEINNIAILCPNCHWELDHELWDINKESWWINKV